MVDVFVSYKREERERCEYIVRRLRALELDVWFDARLTSGMSFDREIGTTLRDAKVVLVLWSPRSVESEWVRNEASLGKDREKLAAVQIETCELPIAFSSTHYETIHESDFGDDHPGWHKLLERVGQLTGRPALASYARALAAAQKDLSAWARNNPDEPLAAKANQIVRELSERPVEGAHKRRPYFRIGLDIMIGLLGIFAICFATIGWIVELDSPRDAASWVDIGVRTTKVLLLSDVYYDSTLSSKALTWLEPARALGSAFTVLFVLRVLTARVAPGLYRVYR